VGDDRREHVERVAALMDAWAVAGNLSEEDRVRWRAAGFLHDALRDGPPEELRRMVDPSLEHVQGSLLHGPAAAGLLEKDGVTDRSLLLSVAFHTLGHPELDALGRSLYVADFLEPGRDDPNDWRRRLRERMPAELDAVVLEVAKAKLVGLVERGRRLHAETVAFWNGLVRPADPLTGSEG
jgi:2-amino-4-hydroxy-6-hydroxymethyldihydropteridine diphosphokinase